MNVSLKVFFLLCIFSVCFCVIFYINHYFSSLDSIWKKICLKNLKVTLLAHLRQIGYLKNLTNNYDNQFINYSIKRIFRRKGSKSDELRNGIMVLLKDYKYLHTFYLRRHRITTHIACFYAAIHSLLWFKRNWYSTGNMWTLIILTYISPLRCCPIYVLRVITKVVKRKLVYKISD